MNARVDEMYSSGIPPRYNLVHHNMKTVCGNLVAIDCGDND